MEKKLNLDRFKVRVWMGNLKEPKMVYVDYQGYMLEIMGNIWENNLPHKIIPMECTGVYDNTEWKELDDIERMAWFRTGRTGEEYKGRVIYEGDIIEGYKYDALAGGFIKTTKIVESDNIGGFNFSIWDIGTLKILGNIYQNPELIEKTKSVFPSNIGKGGSFFSRGL